MAVIQIGTFGGVQSSSTTVSTLSTTTKFIAFPGVHQGTISDVTLNGTSLTKMVGAFTAFNETAEIWYIDNPGALTSVTLSVSYSGGSGPTIGYICLEHTKDGVEDVEATNSGADSSPTVNITPLVNNSIVIASAYAEDNFTQGAGETNIFIVEGATYECAAGSYNIQATAALQTMNFSIGSGQRWAICAVAIAPDQQPPQPSFRVNINGGANLRPRIFAPGIAR